MNTELTPLLTASNAFGWVSGIVFLVAGVYLSIRRGRLHPLLLLCISAISFSWIEAPYDWAMYAQFPPRTSPHAVVVAAEHDLGWAAVVGAPGLHRLFRASRRHRRRARATAERAVQLAQADHASDRRIRRRLLLGAAVQCGLGARLGVFHYAYVIPGLGLFEGTLHQYPIYDAIAMGIQMMVFTYLLGRTDSQGPQRHRDVVGQVFEDQLQSAILSVVAVIVIGNVLYGAVFAPHLVTKQRRYVTSGPTGSCSPAWRTNPDNAFFARRAIRCDH